ncbi:hypothetical protein LUZ60_004421 [Juncus effusus]|nr:hypothetical protein LUZ60_004421 [Juncus effusus]
MAEVFVSFLLPSPWELEMSCAIALFFIVLFFLSDVKSSKGDPDQGGLNRKSEMNHVDENIKLNLCKEDSREMPYVIKLELLAAKYLIGANLNGTSDPYAIISCGEQKRFSSMVPSSRNPLWGEEFIFLVQFLPVQINITMYDWDSVCECKLLGSVIFPIEKEGETGAVWYDLDSKSGQVCLHVSSFKLPSNSQGLLADFVGFESKKITTSEKQRPNSAHHEPGPLQSIFQLPQDEVVYYNYSCALEKSILYHGRIYVSAWHLCFHSNVFTKQLKVIVPLEDIDEIKKSQHSFVNPSITIILHIGAGGHGIPHLYTKNGRVRYKFTSFWNRNRSFRALQNALEKYRSMLQAEKQVKVQSMLNLAKTKNANNDNQTKYEAKNRKENMSPKPFINREVLVEAFNEEFPCTAEQFFNSFLSDNSEFLEEHRFIRKDTNFEKIKWSESDEFGGQIRKITFKSLCNSPLCPPYTSVTEDQHVILSTDKTTLVYETIQQAHDVPFGSYFEIHCRWTVKTNSNSSSLLNVKIGVHMKKWCILQSKIKSGATDEYKKELTFFIIITSLALNQNNKKQKTNKNPKPNFKTLQS